jgi:hypothetical protein
MVSSKHKWWVQAPLDELQVYLKNILYYIFKENLLQLLIIGGVWRPSLFFIYNLKVKQSVACNFEMRGKTIYIVVAIHETKILRNWLSRGGLFSVKKIMLPNFIVKKNWFAIYSMRKFGRIWRKVYYF